MSRMLPPTHYRNNSPDVQKYREKIRLAEDRRRYFEENPSAPGAMEYFAMRREFEERINRAFQPLLDHLADCQRLTAEDLAMRVG